jgi:Tfp pilus assembly protein PilN
LPQLLSSADSLNTSEYATNIGLALRQTRDDISPSRVNLNVTPEVYLPKSFPVIQLASWAFIVLAIIVLLLFGITTIQSYRETMGMMTQVTSIQIQIENRQTTQISIQQLQTQIDEAHNAGAVFTQALDSAKAQRATVNNALSKVTSLLPGIIELNSIDYSTEALNITGIAPDDTTVVDYVRDLTKSGQFSSVLISNMAEMQYNQWQFTLTLR